MRNVFYLNPKKYLERDNEGNSREDELRRINELSRTMNVGSVELIEVTYFDYEYGSLIKVEVPSVSTSEDSPRIIKQTVDILKLLVGITGDTEEPDIIVFNSDFNNESQKEPKNKARIPYNIIDTEMINFGKQILKVDDILEERSVDTGENLYIPKWGVKISYSNYTEIYLKRYYDDAMKSSKLIFEKDYIKDLNVEMYTKNINTMWDLEYVTEHVKKLITQDHGTFELIYGDESIGNRRGYSDKIELKSDISDYEMDELIGLIEIDTDKTNRRFIYIKSLLEFLDKVNNSSGIVHFVDRDKTKGKLNRFSKGGIFSEKSEKILKMRYTGRDRNLSNGIKSF